jgi:hypothetical protein
MAEPDGNRISARLWRLPAQLLLALINATAILVIVAARRTGESPKPDGGNPHAWQYPSGGQGRRTPSPSTRDGATEGGGDRLDASMGMALFQ